MNHSLPHGAATATCGRERLTAKDPQGHGRRLAAGIDARPTLSH
jgi:hypothetical protein